MLRPVLTKRQQHNPNLVRFFKAVQNNNVKAMDIILDTVEHYVLSIDANGNSALIIAAACGYSSMVSHLIHRGSKLDITTCTPGEIGDGYTALIWAIVCRHPETALLILDHPDQSIYKTISSLSEENAMHVAVSYGYIDLANRINEVDHKLFCKKLELGSDSPISRQRLLDGLNAQGNSPLAIATRSGDINMVRTLLEQGAKTNLLTSDWTKPNYNYLSPLQISRYQKSRSKDAASFSAIETLLINANAVDQVNIKSILQLLNYLIKLMEIAEPFALKTYFFGSEKHAYFQRIRNWLSPRVSHQAWSNEENQRQLLRLIHNVCVTTSFVNMLDYFNDWVALRCPHLNLKEKQLGTMSEEKFTFDFHTIRSIISIPSSSSLSSTSSDDLDTNEGRELRSLLHR